VSVQTAYVVGFVLLCASVGLAATVSAPLVATVAGYVGITTA
jgi:hypothetical protein